jgi:hypothetical protein
VVKNLNIIWHSEKDGTYFMKTGNHVWRTVRRKNDEKNELDATSVIYYHKSNLNVSGIYMPIFWSTGCNLLHVVFSIVRENNFIYIFSYSAEYHMQ